MHSDSHAPRANSTADDRHSLVCCVHSSALKAVPTAHVRNPLREPDSNSEARDSRQVQMFVSHAPTSCTAQPVSPLSLKSSIVSRVWQHRATIAKSARGQSLLAAHDTRITPLYIDCDTQSSEISVSCRIHFRSYFRVYLESLSPIAILIRRYLRFSDASRNY